MLYLESMLFYLLYQLVSVPSALGDADRLVETNFGKLKGRLVQLNSPGLMPVEQYLGVPYGQAPSGEKRFVMPQTTVKWTSTVRDATELPPVCTQTFPSYWAATNSFPDKSDLLSRMPESSLNYYNRLRSFLRKEKEDCLYLNLYVPERKVKPQHSLPVLVLIHGESYSFGAGNPYNGSILASYGQIIVVTLNYRLGAFGFLSSGDPICKGNWALADISCALQFIRTIISQFNGDPQRITLLGWDTGAALVNLLMSSPISAPADSRLFKRTILLGGSALSSWATVKNPPTPFYALAENVGCPTAMTNNYNKPEFLSVQNISSCIRTRTAENITKASQDVLTPTFLTSFGPVVDGIFVNNDPAFSLENHGSLFQDLDMMIGLTSNEAYNVLSQKDVVNGIDLHRRDAIFRTLVRNLYQFHRTEILHAITDHYTEWNDPKFNPRSVLTTVTDALSDGLYAAPLIKLARLHASRTVGVGGQSASKNSNNNNNAAGKTKKSNTYVYVFAHNTDGMKRGDLKGSVHNEDLMYILGYPLMDKTYLSNSVYDLPFNDVDKTISETMMKYISNFVKTGNVTSPSPSIKHNDPIGVRFDNVDKKWLPFETDTRENFLKITTDPRVEYYYRVKETAFWNNFIPLLEESGKSERNEDHHLLPDHFTKTSYFGVVRPYPGATLPFPPPPSPPTPMPRELTTILKDLKKKKDEQNAGDDGKQSSTPPTPNTHPVQEGYYSTILSVTVAVGCALLILNILIFAGIYHQRDKQRKQSKKAATTYQSYDISMSGAYNLGSPITPQGPRMPPPPPPPAPMNATVGLNGSSVDGDLHPQLSSGLRTTTVHPHMQHEPGTPHGLYAEQEPLLRRSIVSPTCPRHGKQAAVAAGMGAMEEIQV